MINKLLDSNYYANVATLDSDPPLFGFFSQFLYYVGKIIDLKEETLASSYQKVNGVYLFKSTQSNSYFSIYFIKEEAHLFSSRSQVHDFQRDKNFKESELQGNVISFFESLSVLKIKTVHFAPKENTPIEFYNAGVKKELKALGITSKRMKSHEEYKDVNSMDSRFKHLPSILEKQK